MVKKIVIFSSSLVLASCGFTGSEFEAANVKKSLASVGSEGQGTNVDVSQPSSENSNTDNNQSNDQSDSKSPEDSSEQANNDTSASNDNNGSSEPTHNGSSNSNNNSDGEVRAFPGALGFGAKTTGGRGGKVIFVTNTNSSGAGSLAAAVQASGPRIVVFKVGGIIDLRDALPIRNPNITIAGQTAPGNGIVITGARLVVQANNVIIRGMRFRPGDGPGSAGDQRDGISIGWGSTPIENVIIDSNSVSWSVDEAMSIWGNVRNATYSNNLVGEALLNSIHEKGDHSMGFVIGQGNDSPGPTNISVVRNVMGNTRFRCPLIKNTTNLEMINNYCFNFQHFVETGDNNRVHIIKNFFEFGTNSRDRGPINLGGSNNKFYIKGNLDSDYRTSDNQPDSNSVSGSKGFVVSSPLFTGSVKDILEVPQLKSYLFANTGARWPQRDNTDTRIVNSFKNKISGYVDSPKDVGGYDNYPKGTAPKDSDNDGMPDDFEKAYGYNPNSNDASKDSDGDGYTNIEHYINGIISGF